MGKRKPTVPRRRLGGHFVDLTIQRSVVVDTRRVDAAAGGAAVAAESVVPAPSVPWFPSEPAPTATQSTAGAPASPLPSPTTGDPSGHSTEMLIQRGSASTAVPPHLHHVAKPTVATVPPPCRARDQSDNATASTAAPASEETVTITLAQLEAWKQRTVMQIEDHFTNEQLKRIAEFGRVHANLVKEAKEYVAGIETQLKEQFERERASLKQQAEAYVSQFQQENAQLRQRVQALEDELDQLQEDQGGENEELDHAAESESVAVTASIGSSPNAPSASVSDGASSDSGGDSSLLSRSSDTPASHLSSDNTTRVDAVAEVMSRAMGIRTPRVTVMTSITSPKEVLQLAPSPTTTHESSPVDTSKNPPLIHAQLDPHAVATEEDYL